MLKLLIPLIVSYSLSFRLVVYSLPHWLLGLTSFGPKVGHSVPLKALTHIQYTINLNKLEQSKVSCL